MVEKFVEVWLLFFQRCFPHVKSSALKDLILFRFNRGKISPVLQKTFQNRTNSKLLRPYSNSYCWYCYIELSTTVDYFSLVSLDNKHCGIHPGAIFFLPVQTSRCYSLGLPEAGRGWMAQTCACRWNPVLEVPSVRADMAHIARTTWSPILWLLCCIEAFLLLHV